LGILIDSTVFVAAERRNLDAVQALAEIALRFPGELAVISVVTLAELAHGAARATTSARTEARRQFIQELRSQLAAIPVTAEAALTAGEIDGINRSKGITLGFSDLLIGASALELGYSVATANVRHFQMIPGLSVIQY
jgi:predicted nucleic acid-binding protein